MELNDFGKAVVTQLTRIADAVSKASGGAGSTGAATSDKAGKADTAGKAGKADAKAGKAGKTKPKHSREEVTALLTKVKDDCGIQVAREVMQENGGYLKMGEIQEEHFDQIYDAAEARYAEMVDNSGSEEDL
jgi:hypothetical protein